MAELCYSQNLMKKALYLTLLLSFSLPAIGQAYILPPDFIVRMLVDKQRQGKSQDWSLKLSTEYADQDLLSEERLYLKRPERVRQVETSGQERVYVEREGKSASGHKKVLKLNPGPHTNLLATLMIPVGKTVDERSARIMEFLTQSGIDTSVVSLGRLNQKPAYIVGAKLSETKKPQIWFDKRSFLPVRWLVYSKGDSTGTPIEVRLANYASSPAGSIHPQILETYRDGKFVSRTTVLEAKVNQSLPESLFELP